MTVPNVGDGSLSGWLWVTRSGPSASGSNVGRSGMVQVNRCGKPRRERLYGASEQWRCREQSWCKAFDRKCVCVSVNCVDAAVIQMMTNCAKALKPGLRFRLVSVPH